MDAGGPIMWIILAISIASVAVVIERIICFASRSRGGDAPFSPDARDDDYRASARGAARAARVCWHCGEGELRLAMEAAIRREIFSWEQHISLLDISARISPLLGLLGTVLGMVTMFREIGTSGASAEAVASGIWLALFTTVAGLCAAIPAVVASSLLTSAVEREEERLLAWADAACELRASSDRR